MLDLVDEVWVNQLQGQDFGRADPTTSLLWGGTGAEMIPTHPQPLAVEKIAHRVMSMGELALLLTTFSPLGNRPGTSLEQHSHSTAELTLVEGAGELAGSATHLQWHG